MKDLKNLSKYIKERNIKNSAYNNNGGAKSGDGEEKDMDKEKGKEKGKAGKCPLHRDDDLYSAKNAQEQVCYFSLILPLFIFSYIVHYLFIDLFANLIYSFNLFIFCFNLLFLIFNHVYFSILN
jgi:hypothetical protein